MRRPVWSLELIRDTNAPMESVSAVLAEGGSYARWHPRLKRVEVEIQAIEPFRASYRHNPCPGVEEQGSFELERQGERLLMVHRAKFKGWPVLLLMGWWRLRSHRMWERLVESL